MQKHVKDQSLISRPINEEAQVSTKPRWLHFSSFGCTLLIVLTVLTSITQLTHTQNTYAVVLKKSATATSTTNVKAKATGSFTAQKLSGQNPSLTFTADITTTNLPASTPIVAHIHDASCTGTILFALKGETDSSGSSRSTLKLSNTFTQEIVNGQNEPLPDKIPSNWYFNFHDGSVINPADGKPFSLGCKEFTLDNNNNGGKATVSNHTITLP